MTEHARTTAIVWGEEPPAFSIGYDRPMWAGDSGFTVLFDDAPEPEDLPEGDDELPEGIIAREHGVADLNEFGQWVVGDLSRLDPS